MDFNTLLIRLGIDPGNFVNKDSEPIKEGNTFIYPATQRTDVRECPNCHSSDAEARSHQTVEIECSETDFARDVLRITKTRFLCKSCGRTYRHWRVEIANGLATSQNGARVTNGIAEAINNVIKTIIKSAYGYRNFERFRKRVMLIVTYSKK